MYLIKQASPHKAFVFFLRKFYFQNTTTNKQQIKSNEYNQDMNKL